MLAKILSVYEPESFRNLNDMLAVFGEVEEIGAFVERLEGL